jgi:hypothetical protein
MYRKRSGPVAEFKDPDWRDSVVVPARQATWGWLLAGRYDSTMPESTLSPSQRSMNAATECWYAVCNAPSTPSS